MEITPKDSVNIEAYVNQVQEKDKVEPTSEQPEKQQVKADTVELSDMGKSVSHLYRGINCGPDHHPDCVSHRKCHRHQGREGPIRG